MPEGKYREALHIFTCHECQGQGGKSEATQTHYVLVRNYNGDTLSNQALYRFEGDKPIRIEGPAFISEAQYKDLAQKKKFHELSKDYLQDLLNKTRNTASDNIAAGTRILFQDRYEQNGEVRYGLRQSGVIENVRIKVTDLSLKVTQSDGIDFEAMFSEPPAKPAEDFDLQLADINSKSYRPGDEISPNYAEGDTGKLPNLPEVQKVPDLPSGKPLTLAESARARVATPGKKSKHEGQAKKPVPIKPSPDTQRAPKK